MGLLEMIMKSSFNLALALGTILLIFVVTHDMAVYLSKKTKKSE